MRNLYVKIAAVVVVAFALSFGVVLALRPFFEERPRPDQTAYLMGLGVRWAAEACERAGPEGWGAKLAEMQPSFGFPLAVLGAAEARASLPEDAQLSAAEPATYGPHEGPRLFVPLRGGTWYFVAGPIPHRPRAKPPAMLTLVPVWLALSISIISALAIATPISRRLRTLERATRAVAAGDLRVRVGDRSKDVVGQLAESFDAMAARLEHLFAQRERLLQAVSHEIATPLARMRFHLDALERAVIDASKRDRLAALDADFAEIDQLAKEMSSWVDADGRRPTLGPVALEPLLAAIVGGLSAPVEGAKEVELCLLDAGLQARADERQLRRALENVVRNAFRYARSRVVIAARSEGDRVRVEVRDDGPGIPVAARARIFEPFARLDESRSRKGGGMGLGLAITQRIVEAHQGEVWIEDAPEGGATVVSRWPAVAPESPGERPAAAAG